LFIRKTSTRYRDLNEDMNLWFHSLNLRPLDQPAVYDSDYNSELYISLTIYSRKQQRHPRSFFKIPIFYQNYSVITITCRSGVVSLSPSDYRIIVSSVCCPGQTKAPLPFFQRCHERRLKVLLPPEINCDQMAMGLPPVTCVFLIVGVSVEHLRCLSYPFRDKAIPSKFLATNINCPNKSNV
jgi:hypothetical protein